MNEGMDILGFSELESEREQERYKTQSIREHLRVKQSLSSFWRALALPDE